MRAIWSGSIGFGLVNIPVKLFSATQDSQLDLDMLDKHGHANIRYARINADTGKEVEWADIVKGYKLNDRYVVLTDADFEKVAPLKSKIITINEFTSEDAIDTTFYEMPYYLEPTKGGEKAYVLLREALKQSGKVAIGQFVMRNKESLCLLRAQDDVLLLLKIRFPEEIREYSDLNIPGDISVKPAELKMAQTLINQLTPKKLSLDKYKDTYDEALLKIIQAKAKGKKVTTPAIKIESSRSKDLMAQLKASLTPRKKAS
ncbi:Ku protein [Nemorincola caseinilytica]|uniref:Non-homologous end joining protein Ku n=1 Tax=Nemorincola caseinilytica TaxID=2054315 RepID=A0ABP8N587_9BACT